MTCRGPSLSHRHGNLPLLGRFRYVRSLSRDFLGVRDILRIGTRKLTSVGRRLALILAVAFRLSTVSKFFTNGGIVTITGSLSLAELGLTTLSAAFGIFSLSYYLFQDQRL
jgi:hypothetical protein